MDEAVNKRFSLKAVHTGIQRRQDEGGESFSTIPNTFASRLEKEKQKEFRGIKGF